VPARKPTIYLIAGCNGAGKTTFAKEFLPNEVKCLRFLNADEIARGLSPLEPQAGAVKAARLLLKEIKATLRRRQTFALETTLSGKTYVRLLQRARRGGYEIELHYLWLSSPDQAIARVASVCEQADTTFRGPTFAVASAEVLPISLVSICRRQRAGPFGTTAAGPQNGWPFPAHMISKP
jgi:predicted kinase